MASSKSSTRPGARRPRSIYSISLSSSSSASASAYTSRRLQRSTTTLAPTGGSGSRSKVSMGRPIVSREDSWRSHRGHEWPLRSEHELSPQRVAVGMEPVLLGTPSRRKSALGRLSSFLIPSLNSSSADDARAAAGIPRKPIGAAAFPEYPNDRPVYRQPAGFAAGPTEELPPGLGLYSSAQPPMFIDNHSRQYQVQPGQHIPHQPQPHAAVPEAARNSYPSHPPSVIHKAPKHGVAPRPPPKDTRPVPPIPQVHQTQASPPMLKKTRERKRSSSFSVPDPAMKDPRDQRGTRLQPRRRGSPTPEARVRSASAHPPSSRPSQVEQARVASNAQASRPQSAYSSDGGGSDKGKLRRSWLPGTRSRSNSQDLSQQQARNSPAWVMSPESNADYNVAFLLNGEKVPELWNENGSVYVYLNPKGVDQGASFKVPSYIFSNSRVLSQLIQSDIQSPVSARSRGRSFGGRGHHLSVDDANRRNGSPPNSPPDGQGESRLYLPAAPMPNGQHGQSPTHPQSPRQDLERLIALRNLFAFLTGQPLVGTQANGTLFLAFMQIAALLREFDFSSADGSTFGEAADLSFGFIMGQMGLADVRLSREKTIEALILGEQMRSWDLYNEAFTHAVGKYSAIMDLKLPLFDLVTMNTRRRLERAHLDLLNRQHNVNIRLEQFEFPGLFAGVASSTSNSDYKNIRFKNWRTTFGDMRSFVLKYYKTQFGNWPPKASSKKNTFSESGLNRQVLKALYSDLCSLYDLMVDREALTPRGLDQAPDELEEGGDPTVHALRKLLSEFDHSSPPVLPPIPFDVPKLPDMAAINETYHGLAPKEQTRFDKHVQPHELQLILLKSHNIDADSVRTPFLQSFKDFELKEARGKSAVELAEQRIGYWVFLYVVMQCLPMLVVDAPNVHATEGVEYFLSVPPMGNLPWLEDVGEVRKAWYQTAGGTNVELSADVVMFSVEATYHRSHAWLAAKRWEADAAAGTLAPGAPPILSPPPFLPPADLAGAMSPLEPPRHFFADGAAGDPLSSPSSIGTPPSSAASNPYHPRGRSPHAPNGHRPSSIAMGLEPVDFPAAAGNRHSSAPQVPSPREARRIASAGNLRASAHQNQQRSGRRAESGNRREEARGHHVHHHPQQHGGGLPHRGVPDRQGSQATQATTGSTGSSTFDDILSGMDSQKVAPPKKRSSFLPF